jgi:hypothetical protein
LNQRADNSSSAERIPDLVEIEIREAGPLPLLVIELRSHGEAEILTPRSATEPDWDEAA